MDTKEFREAGYRMIDWTSPRNPVRELRCLADRYFPLIPYYGLRPFDTDVPRAEDWLRARSG